MKKYTVNLKQRSYDINIKPGIIDDLPSILSEFNKGQKWIILSQYKLMELFGFKLEKKLLSSGYDCVHITLPIGEAAKSINEYNRAISQMIEFGCDRGTTIISLGGGAVGDVSGFISSTFMRGIEYFQIPTTLLSMVDSSIGGKTGINIPQGKNLIGTFYQPQAVFIDQDLLNSLPNEEIVSGIGEIIKYGAILDIDFFNEIVDWVQDIKNFPFEKAIATCCKLKADIVSKDEEDNDIRSILNFGHTVGHALELKFGFNSLKHGEAVSLGMLSAGYISYKLGKINKKEFGLLEHTIRSLPLPNLKKLDIDEIISFIKRDKKYEKGKLKFVILKKMGHAVVTTNIDDKLLRASIKIL